METSINQITPVEYEFELHATAEDLEPKLKKALRQQAKHMDLPGFRKGKVPTGIVKKRHGQAIGQQVAEEVLQEAFEDALDARDDLDMLGQPMPTTFEYELDGDFHAAVKFGVRPQIGLADLSDESIPMLKHAVTDEDVEDEIERLRSDHADLLPVEDEPAGEGDFVNVDMQRIDPSTDTPIIGDKDEGLTFFLDDERLREELRDALLGKSPGDTFRVMLPQDAPPQAGGAESMEGQEERLYEVTLNDVKRRDLPEIDDEFVQHVTDGEVETPDALRDELRKRLEDAYESQAREMVQSEIIDKMLELHVVPVPESVVESTLDSFVNQVKQRNDGELPDDFDEALFREQNREDAEKQSRWMLIRDQVIDDFDLEADDEDLQDFFAEQAEGEPQLSVEQLKQFYTSMPRMMERVKQEVLSRKVYDLLLDRFDVDEMDLDAFREMMEERHQHRQALAGGPATPDLAQ